MPVQKRSPTSDITIGSGITPYPAEPTTCWDKLDDDSADDDATYIYWTVSATTASFGFNAFNIPAGSIINSVKCYFRHKKIAAETCYLKSQIRVGINVYDGTNENPTENQWKTTVTTWLTNPKTELPWTVDDVNGMGENALNRMQLRSTDASPNPYCTQEYLEVDYTLPVGGKSQGLII